MFKTILNVCMYSGMCHLDPCMELNIRETEALLEKISRLKTLPKSNYFGMGLGPDCFGVNFITLDIDPTNYNHLTLEMDINKYPEIIDINSKPGIVTVTRLVDPTQTIYYEDSFYEDDVNIHGFLSELAEPAIRRHRDDSQMQMEAYFNSFGVKLTNSKE